MSEPLTVPIGSARRTTLLALANAPAPPQGEAGQLARVLGGAVGRLELLRVDGGGLARVRGWWGPAGLLLHRTGSERAASRSPYVLARAVDLPGAVLRALKACPPDPGPPDPGPKPVRVGPVGEVLAVARGQDRAWLRELGAEAPGEVALVRWEAVAGGVGAVEEHARLLAVRALLLTPAGAVRLAPDVEGTGVVLVPTDRSAEHAALAAVHELFAATARRHVAEVARRAVLEPADALSPADALRRPEAPPAPRRGSGPAS